MVTPFYIAVFWNSRMLCNRLEHMDPLVETPSPLWAARQPVDGQPSELPLSPEVSVVVSTLISSPSLRRARRLRFLGIVTRPSELNVTTPPAERVELGLGTRVCFTGEAIVDGHVANRAMLEKIATLAGMLPLKSVTKKCDVLVAADPLSQSGKARTARDRGIPIISIQDFLDAT